ncbi:MAG: SCO family protein, partial [Pseudomonadota bacterium]
FTAIKQNNQSLSENDFRGHLSLINFFFVACPKVCPLMMRNVQNLQKTLGSQMSQVQIYSFSVQPEMDTPERLRSYAETYQIDLTNWTLLTGKKKQIYNVGKNMFKADGAVGKQKSEENFIHTQNIYLVDNELNIRGIYNSNDPKDMQQLKEDIDILGKKAKLAKRF